MSLTVQTRRSSFSSTDASSRSDSSAPSSRHTTPPSSPKTVAVGTQQLKEVQANLVKRNNMRSCFSSVVTHGKLANGHVCADCAPTGDGSRHVCPKVREASAQIEARRAHEALQALHQKGERLKKAFKTAL